MYFRFFFSFLSFLIHDNDDDCWWWCYNSWEMNKCDCALFPITFQAFSCIFSSLIYIFHLWHGYIFSILSKIVELKFPSQWVCMFCLFRAHSFQLTREIKYFLLINYKNAQAIFHLEMHWNVELLLYSRWN